MVSAVFAVNFLLCFYRKKITSCASNKFFKPQEKTATSTIDATFKAFLSAFGELLAKDLASKLQLTDPPRAMAEKLTAASWDFHPSEPLEIAASPSLRKDHPVKTQPI